MKRVDTVLVAVFGGPFEPRYGLFVIAPLSEHAAKRESSGDVAAVGSALLPLEGVRDVTSVFVHQTQREGSRRQGRGFWGGGIHGVRWV